MHARGAVGTGIESQLARLEAAEVVFGQWAEATDGGRRSSGIVEPEPEPEPEPERVVAGPGAGGMRLVPDRSEGMGVESLTSEYRRIMEIVTGADGPVMAKDVAWDAGPGAHAGQDRAGPGPAAQTC